MCVAIEKIITGYDCPKSISSEIYNIFRLAKAKKIADIANIWPAHGSILL